MAAHQSVEEQGIIGLRTEDASISGSADLTHELAHIEAIGGYIEEIQMAEDVQRELIAEMVDEAEHQSSLHETNIFLLGLRYFHGYLVVSTPLGSGVHVVYH